MKILSVFLGDFHFWVNKPFNDSHFHASHFLFDKLCCTYKYSFQVAFFFFFTLVTHKEAQHVSISNISNYIKDLNQHQNKHIGYSPNPLHNVIHK